MKQRRGAWTRIVFFVISCLLLVVISGFVYEWIASKQDKLQYPPLGKMVDVGGYRLHIRKLGSGTPTILLESGSGESSLSWRDIPENLSSFATVVSYDRAGYAWSEEATTPRTGENIVRELHVALKNTDIQPPYISDEVAGLVLVDARPENDARRTNEIYAKERPKVNPTPLIFILLERSGAFRLFPNFMLTGRVEDQDRKSFVNIVASPKYFRSVAEEGDLASTTENAIRGQHLGNLPVRVIARGIQQNLTQFGISKHGNEQIEQSWQVGQREMLNISTNSKFIVAKKSDHMIIHDQPELVIQVIRELINNINPTRSTVAKTNTDG
jgi:pimeloyl-ACP methyl ester carboxylesterase